MSCELVIPVKQLELAKARLASVLSVTKRVELAGAMLRHVLAAAQAADRIDRVSLLGASRLGMNASVPLLPDPGQGLNPALQGALASFAGKDVTRLIVLFADLPKLTTQDVQLLASAPAGTIAIAPDRHGIGTNALSLPLPAAEGFTFAFGPDSFALHNAEAGRLGLPLEVIHSQGLARDVDVPEDLADASGLSGA